MKKSIFKKGAKELCIKTIGNVLELMFKSEIDFDDDGTEALECFCDVVKTKSFVSDLYDEMISKISAGREEELMDNLSKKEFVETYGPYFAELTDKILERYKN